MQDTSRSDGVSTHFELPWFANKKCKIAPLRSMSHVSSFMVSSLTMVSRVSRVTVGLQVFVCFVFNLQQ